jgi:mono/diheme cytochrome c family protein
MSENNDNQYNRGGMIAFLFSMVFVFAFFIYIVAIHPGIDLQENIQDPPSASAVAEVAVDVSKVTEPWVANEDMVKHGKKLFAQNCAMCHGNEGHGDGPAGQALNPRPRNLVEGPWKKGGGYIGWFTVLTHGIEGSSMASFAHFKVVDRWALVQFIDSITKAKVKEDAAKVAEFAKTQK